MSNPFRKKPAAPAPDRPTLTLQHRVRRFTPEEAENLGCFTEDALSYEDALAAREPDEVGP